MMVWGTLLLSNKDVGKGSGEFGEINAGVGAIILGKEGVK